MRQTKKVDPYLIEAPMPIRTPRLLIKPREIGEGAVLFQAVRENVEHLQDWMPWVHAHKTVEDSESYCRSALASFIVRTNFDLSIYDHSGREFIGSLGVHNADWDVPSFMTGYWIVKKHEGKGYITEALNAITRYGFEVFKANRIYLTCDARNVRSVAVMKRLGFQQEALIRNESRDAKGDLRTTLMYARYDLAEMPELQVTWR